MFVLNDTYWYVEVDSLYYDVSNHIAYRYLEDCLKHLIQPISNKVLKVR